MAHMKDINNNNKSLMLKIYVATTTETMLFSNLPQKFKKYARMPMMRRDLKRSKM